MTYKKTIESIDKLNVDQYRVTQNNGTERPFEGEYDKHFYLVFMLILCLVSHYFPQQKI